MANAQRRPSKNRGGLYFSTWRMSPSGERAGGPSNVLGAILLNGSFDEGGGEKNRALITLAQPLPEFWDGSGSTVRRE